MIDIYDSDGWRLGLGTYAYVMSAGKWHPWHYLQFTAKKIEEVIRRGNGRLIINWPPRHGKSELVSKWLPIWFLDLYPDKRVFVISYSEKQARKWGRKVRDELFYNKFALTKPRRDARSVTDWFTTDGGAMFSTSIKGTMIGEGGDLIIIDDPHKSWKEALSVFLCEEIYDFYKNTLYHRQEPGASIIINQTRWTPYDLTGQILDADEDSWEHLCIPAIAKENDILGRKIGEALCPPRYPISRLLQIQKVLGLSFDAIFNQTPVALEGNIVKRDWIKRFSDWPSDLDEMIQSWDATFKVTGTSKVGGLIIGRKGSNFFFLDQIQKKMSFTETVRAIEIWADEYPNAITKLIEDKANGAAIMDVLKNKLVGIQGFSPEKYGSKEARFSAVSPMFKAGNIWVPAKSLAPWGDDLIEEWINFPNHAFRDRTDATSQGLLHMQKQIGMTNVLDLDLSSIGGTQRNPWRFANVG